VRYGRRAVTLGPVSARCLLPALLACSCQHTLVVGSDPSDAAAPGPASLTEGLLAHWKLDDGPGAQRALDSSGHDDHAVPEAVSSTDWIAGRIGGALLFGNAGWLRGTDAASIDAIRDGGLSIALWISVDSAEDREQVILQRQVGTGADAHFLLSLRLGRPALSGVDLARCEAPALPPGGGWVHLAVTFDGTFERFYLDGLPVTECPASATFPADVTSVTVGGGQIGAGPFAVDRRLRALLDEVLLYSRPLSPGEIGALAAGQLPPGR
jgi:hypothetical protein